MDRDREAVRRVLEREREADRRVVDRERDREAVRRVVDRDLEREADRRVVDRRGARLRVVAFFDLERDRETRAARGFVREQPGGQRARGVALLRVARPPSEKSS